MIPVTIAKSIAMVSSSIPRIVHIRLHFSIFKTVREVRRVFSPQTGQAAYIRRGIGVIKPNEIRNIT